MKARYAFAIPRAMKSRSRKVNAYVESMGLLTELRRAERITADRMTLTLRALTGSQLAEARVMLRALGVDVGTSAREQAGLSMAAAKTGSRR